MVIAPPGLYSNFSQTLTSYCSVTVSEILVFDASLGFDLHVKSVFHSFFFPFEEHF